jgi:1-acyl-sn-glycerol-3-phosphate acyltransferase
MELNRWWRAGLPIATPLLRLVLKVRVEGAERVPSRGPALLAFNHVSVLDGPAIAIESARRLRRETRYLVASEVFRTPLIGWILRRYEQIPIRRGEGDEHALDEAIETVRAGAMAAIAPEGRVNDHPEHGLQRIRRGAARIALPTGAPIVPVGIWGTQRRWSRAGINWNRLWRRPRVGLVFGPPILPSGEGGSQDDIEALTQKLAERLKEHVARARELAD